MCLLTIEKLGLSFITPLLTKGHLTTGGIILAGQEKLEVHPHTKNINAKLTKWSHKTVNSTAFGTQCCVAADKKTHFSARWAELRISREGQWLTALLCYPLYWLWVKGAHRHFQSLLISKKQAESQMCTRNERVCCYSAEKKWLTGVQSIMWSSHDSYVHISRCMRNALVAFRYLWFYAFGTVLRERKYDFLTAKTFSLVKL